MPKWKAGLLLTLWFIASTVILLSIETMGMLAERRHQPATMELTTVAGERIRVEVAYFDLGPEGQPYLSPEQGWLSFDEVRTIHPESIEEPLTWRTLLAILTALSFPVCAYLMAYRWTKNQEFN